MREERHRGGREPGGTGQDGIFARKCGEVDIYAKEKVRLFLEDKGRPEDRSWTQAHTRATNRRCKADNPPPATFTPAGRGSLPCQGPLRPRR